MCEFDATKWRRRWREGWLCLCFSYARHRLFLLLLTGKRRDRSSSTNRFRLIFKINFSFLIVDKMLHNKLIISLSKTHSQRINASMCGVHKLYSYFPHCVAHNRNAQWTLFFANLNSVIEILATEINKK